MRVYVQAWFLDQFGVLHDGKKPYPGAILTCMFSSLPFRIVMAIDSIMFNVWFLVFGFCLIIVEKLAMTGSKMVILSNSSRRASATIEKLKNLGFDPSLFVGAITSGELTHQYLQRLTTLITNAQVILINSILTMCGNLFILCFGLNFISFISIGGFGIE